VQLKKGETRLTNEQMEEIESLTKSLTVDDKAGYHVPGSDKGKVHNMLVKLGNGGA
jgi:hypothetical protein